MTVSWQRPIFVASSNYAEPSAFPIAFPLFIENLFYVFIFYFYKFWEFMPSQFIEKAKESLSTKRRGYKRYVTIGDVIFIIYLFAELSFTNNGSQSTFDNWLQKYVTNYAKLLYDKAFKDQILIFFSPHFSYICFQVLRPVSKQHREKWKQKDE